jgi:hypothetical protein
MDKKSGNNLASKPSKWDVRYWLRRVFKPRSVHKSGAVYVAAFYFARFQYSGRLMTMSLGTANRAEAAARAKERYLYLRANGWHAFTEKYLSVPEPEFAIGPKANITVGQFIEAACTESSLATVTIGHYARAFRRIVADIFEVPDKFHDRYLLTELGSCQVWRGFEIEKGIINTLYRLDRTKSQSLETVLRGDINSEPKPTFSFRIGTAR